MHQPTPKLTLVTLALACALGLSLPAQAQIAGTSTTLGVSVTESTQLALGWSAKKTLLGKTVYNEAGKKVGKVEDLIISPDKSVSYVIVGAGGFVGIGRHDVAIPVTQIQDTAGKLVMAGASKETIQAMPAFVYATDTTRRDAFVTAAQSDITKGKAEVARLETQAGAAATDTRAKIQLDITALQKDVTAAEGKLAELKQASAARWKEFEADVSAATARLRKSTQKLPG